MCVFMPKYQAVPFFEADRRVHGTYRQRVNARFEEECRNLSHYCWDHRGRARRTCVIALGVSAVEAGHRVLFLTLDSLLSKLKWARDENRLEKQLQQWVYPKVLILDEMGYLPLSREDASLLFRLI